VTALRRRPSARLDRILDAAEALVRETGGVRFTMKAVAARAEVAPATPYNLLGSKDGLLYALLNRSLDALFIGLVHFQADDPLEHPIEAGTFAAELFASDPAVYRELFAQFLGIHDELHRPWFLQRSLSYWKHSLDTAVRLRRLPPEEAERDDLARLLMAQFIGCVDLWVSRDLDDSGFRAQVTYGICRLMLSFADGPGRERLLARIEESRRHLPPHRALARYAAQQSPAPPAGGIA
jgi:AcrR family transcriptional regulator